MVAGDRERQPLLPPPDRGAAEDDALRRILQVARRGGGAVATAFSSLYQPHFAALSTLTGIQGSDCG